MSKARDFRKRAWSALSGKWGTMIMITILLALIEGACGGLSIIGVGAIALLLITGPLTLGVTATYLKVIRGDSVQVGDMFSGFKNFANAFILYLLTSIFTALWTLLFIFPGIIKSYSYSMGGFILADNPNMDGNEARKASMALMKGKKWRLFCLDCSFIGWYLLGILTFGLLLFWVQPYHEAARAEFYQEISGGAQKVDGGAPVGETVNVPDDNGSAFGTGYSDNASGEPEKAENPNKDDSPFSADDL